MLPLIFLSFLLIFGGRLVGNVVKNKETIGHKSVIVEKTIEPSASPEPTKEAKVQGAKIEVKVETKSSPAPSASSNQDINNFKYPNAKVVSSSSNSLSLESSDESKKITDWYMAKIEEKNMNVKTFVTTKANEKIENKLVGANGDGKIEIEIKGNEGGTLTITVATSNN